MVSTKAKQGRSGPLTFVVVQHTISQDGKACVVEEQDIVYRAASSASRPVVPELDDSPTVGPGVGEQRLALDPTHLFRFSALTRNSHRIHYDRPYAESVEGYAGLVVHGPLQAMLMAEAARAHGAAGRLTMRYRLVAPLLDHEGLVVGVEPRPDGWHTKVRADSGRLKAAGTVVSTVGTPLPDDR